MASLATNGPRHLASNKRNNPLNVHTYNNKPVDAEDAGVAAAVPPSEKPVLAGAAAVVAPKASGAALAAAPKAGAAAVVAAPKAGAAAVVAAPKAGVAVVEAAPKAGGADVAGIPKAGVAPAVVEAPPPNEKPVEAAAVDVAAGAPKENPVKYCL